MGGGDHCAVWGCDNDRRYPQWIVQMDHVRSVKFHSCKNLKDFPRWKKLIGRADPNFRVTAHTKVCSNHFKYGQPTAYDPHPSLYLKGYPGISTPAKSKPIRRKLTYSGPSASKTSKSIRKKRNSSTLSAASSATFLEGYDECSCNESTTHTGNVVVENKNADQKSPPIVEQVLKEHNYAVDSDEVSSAARCKPFEVCQRCVNHHKRINDLEQELQKAWELIKTLQIEMDSLQHKNFSIDDIKHDDHLVELYTGIPTYGVFKFLSEKLEGKVTKMQYYKGVDSHKSKRYQVNDSHAKPGRKRALNCENELLLVLARLRQGLSLEDLAFRFKVSVSSVSGIISTWVPFLGRELASLIYWPRKDELQLFYPEAFKQFPHVSSIIDCTEIFLERPSMADTQALTYSTYKSHNTAKYLISLTPAGVVSFVSKGYGGLSSDRHIFEDCGVISKFEQNTACMVDRGFNVQDLLLMKQVKLYMPPFTKGQSQFTKQKVQMGQGIAKARIHVERAIERVKRFRIFNSVIPLKMKDLLDDIVLVCSALTNLMPPLIQNRG